jgi:hypothetical protein
MVVILRVGCQETPPVREVDTKDIKSISRFRGRGEEALSKEINLNDPTPWTGARTSNNDHQLQITAEDE